MGRHGRDDGCHCRACQLERELRSEELILDETNEVGESLADDAERCARVFRDLGVGRGDHPVVVIRQFCRLDDVRASSKELDLVQMLRSGDRNGEGRGVYRDAVASPITDALPERFELRTVELRLAPVDIDGVVDVVGLGSTATTGRHVLAVETVSELGERLIDDERETADRWVGTRVPDSSTGRRSPRPICWRRSTSEPLWRRKPTWKTFGLSQPSFRAEWEKMKARGLSLVRIISLCSMISS